ncbi:polysaccharide deacetylase family protein [Blastomonas sp.]|uniref:polysaccharide deacetylase family protein n=1 Tax=Blastomonas sp. TaxID=1909299 RepID=UPI0039189444
MMVTRVQFTVDTELSLKLYQEGASAQENFDSSIAGKCRDGEYGIFYQMDRLEAAGLTGVFFVDPMPALVYGPGVVARIVEPILKRGHEVQLHIHTEWLEFARDHEYAHLRGRNIADFALDDQIRLLEQARALLMMAGAPKPTAFRAGNFGANNNTLRALSALGIPYDSSFNPAFLAGECDIDLPVHTPPFSKHLGVGIIPVSVIEDRPGSIRGVQLCALSAWEMRDALVHAADDGWPCFTIVSHSFELLSRDRSRANPIVVRRFDAMCRNIAKHGQLEPVGFATLEPHARQSFTRLPTNLVRTVLRYGEQAVSRMRYEAGILSTLFLNEFVALEGMVAI